MEWIVGKFIDARFEAWWQFVKMKVSHETKMQGMLHRRAIWKSAKSHDFRASHFDLLRDFAMRADFAEPELAPDRTTPFEEFANAIAFGLVFCLPVILLPVILRGTRRQKIFACLMILVPLVFWILLLIEQLRIG